MLEKDRIIKTPSECSEGVALSIGYGIDTLSVKRAHCRDGAREVYMFSIAFD